MCGAVSARSRRVARLILGIAFLSNFGVRSYIGECNCRVLDALAGEFRDVQRLRKGKQCAAYYWGMQLQSARRIGRRVQRSWKGKQCAAYYWGMQLQSGRRIGRRVQRLRKGKQCAAYYWGMQLQSPRRNVRSLKVADRKAMRGFKRKVKKE